MKISTYRTIEGLKRLQKKVNEILWSISFELEDDYNISEPFEEYINNEEHIPFLLGYFEAYSDMNNKIKKTIKEVRNE